MGDQNTCHKCGALLAGDKRCRYCGTPAGAGKSRRGWTTDSGSGGSGFTMAVPGWLFLPGLLLMPVLAVVAICYYVLPAPVWFGPGWRLVIILALLFIASAMLILIDAAQIGKNEDLRSALGSPIRWFKLTLIGWFWAAPLYLRARSKLVANQPEWALAAITGLSAAVLLFTLIGVGVTISKSIDRSKDKESTEIILRETLEKYGKGSLETVPEK